MNARSSLMRTLAALILALSMIVPAVAGTTAIVGATVHTAGPAGSLEQATVVITDGKIAAVGADVDVPDGATVIDGAGLVVTPGVIDSYSVAGLVEIGLEASTVDYRLKDNKLGAGFQVFYGFNPDSTVIPITRIEGVTGSVIAPQIGENLFAGQGALVHLGNGDNIVRASLAVFAGVGLSGGEVTGGSRAAALGRLARALDEARYYDAHRAAYDKGATRDFLYGRADLEALVPVIKGKKPLAVIANRASDIRNLLKIAAKANVRLVIIGGSEAWKLADDIAAAGVPVIINPADDLPASFDGLFARLDNAARLQAAGVTIAFGSEVNDVSGFGTHNARLLTQMAGIAVANGLPWEAALAALTSNPAGIWGVADEVGTIAPGKQADVVVWTGDPFELSTRPKHVFIRGEDIPLVSRQTRLRDRYLNLKDQRMPFAYR